MVFEKAIDKAEPAEEVKQRVINLIDCITYSVYVFTNRGMFERDKLTFVAQMTFQVTIDFFIHTFTRSFFFALYHPCQAIT